MAHALADYDGLCRHIHGHSYKLHVTVSGRMIEEKGHPKNGMVMDFKDLKPIVKEHIVDRLDHALVLQEGAYPTLETPLASLDMKVVYTTYPPTCERMLQDFAHTISNHLPAHVKLHSLKLWETATCYAEWYSDEQ
jgi:6-pyruvoyltetrahydropterin/6-carboxytetrahydropterin synthase